MSKKYKVRRVAALEPLESRRLLTGVTTSLTLTDLSGAALPQSSPGAWTIPQGTTFRVVLSATVTSPNMTNSGRTTAALRNQPLGLNVLDTDIVTSGKDIVDPVTVAAQNSPQWAGYQDLTPNQFAAPFTNVFDTDGDGDPDVAGAGMFSTNFVLSSTASLSQFQYGAGAAGSATAGPMKILLGEYKAVNGGSTKLSTHVLDANVYADTNPDTAVTSVRMTSGFVNGAITINVTGTSKVGSISGSVFNDANKNGTFDGGDTALSARKVFIDANNNGKLDFSEKSVTTNASGVYTFTGLAAGTYVIRRADTPAGYTITEPVGGAYTIALSAGQNVSGKDIGAVQGTVSTNSASISGTVFNDANKDGKFDAGDAALSARKMYIDANKNGKLDTGEKTATSNASGVYTFSGLAAGTYEIRRADTPAGYSFTEPASGFYDVTVAAAQVVTGKDFGAVLGSNTGGGNTASISGTVFNDGNDNGKRDSGESLLSSRKMYIDANKNGKLDAGEKSVLTNASGVYTFSGLAAGTYEIRRADTPAGYKITDPASGFYDITVVAGQIVTGKDIGAFA